MDKCFKLFFAVIISLACFLFAAHISGILVIYKQKDNALLPSFSNRSFIVTTNLKRIACNNLVCLTMVDKSGKNNVYIRRIAGLEGDTLEINNGYLLRNGFMADNPDKIMLNYYVYKARVRDYKMFDNLKVKPTILKDSILLCMDYPESEDIGRYLLLHKLKPNERNTISYINPTVNFMVVPKGYCFVLADNRDNYEDSRHWGFVPVTNIKAVGL